MHYLEKRSSKLFLDIYFGARMDLAKIKEEYERQRDEIIKKLDALLDDDVDIAGDELDKIQGKQLTDLIEKLSKRDEIKLQRIFLALRKIKDGTFGICENCEELIQEKRLLAIPGVCICINCAEEIERNMLMGNFPL
jgi:DnaK suppressor protein